MIDLHAHSSRSDGTDPPAALVAAAADAGLRALALTDHDTLDGLDEARAAAGEYALELVAGCEVSAALEELGVHLLCYFVPVDGALAALLVERRARRAERNARLLAHLAGLGLPISPKEVEAVANGAVVGRPHLAAVLVANGAARDAEEAFTRFLSDRALGPLSRAGTAATAVLEAARADRAPVALAHPLDVGAGLDRVVATLAGMGLCGLEAAYAGYAGRERIALGALARRHGLVATGGSDYHGTRTPGCALGTGYGDLCVDDAVLEELRARR